MSVVLAQRADPLNTVLAFVGARLENSARSLRTVVTASRAGGWSCRCGLRAFYKTDDRSFMQVENGRLMCFSGNLVVNVLSREIISRHPATQSTQVAYLKGQIANLERQLAELWLLGGSASLRSNDSNAHADFFSAPMFWVSSHFCRDSLFNGFGHNALHLAWRLILGEIKLVLDFSLPLYQVMVAFLLLEECAHLGFQFDRTLS